MRDRTIALRHGVLRVNYKIETAIEKCVEVVKTSIGRWPLGHRRRCRRPLVAVAQLFFIYKHQTEQQ